MAEQAARLPLAARNAGPVDVFLKSGPGQSAILATIVTFGGQAAAQIGLPVPWPALVAIGFALLAAVYHVRVVQKLHGANCLLSIPIVALIAFTSGWGANGLIDVAKSGGKAAQADLDPLVGVLKQEIASHERRLRLQAEELAILRRLSGVPTAPTPGPSGHLDGTSFAYFLEALVPSAHAQGAPRATAPLTASERERLQRELRERENRQRALADESERLRRERVNTERRGKQPLPPWQKW
jgi:hypothetical protein